MKEDCNETLIALIPKVGRVKNMNEIRPISLCNTSYKILAKILSARLKKVLPKIIDWNQSAFVEGRLITDNIIVAYECMHWIKQRKGKKKGYAALKLDMSKAYDRIEWKYLKEVMKCMDFPEGFTDMIFSCVSSVSYSFILNHKIYGKIVPERGLRQGDPLSPLLFVLCAQGLSSLIHHEVALRNIEGIRFGCSDIEVSHLFFADDSLMFFKDYNDSYRVLYNCLKKYEAASGHMVNFSKSAISFSKSMDEGKKEEIAKYMGINSVQGHSIYLGMPIFSLKNKRMQFGFIRDRIAKRMEKWSMRVLSAGGKEVLIKSVIQAIPTYTMSCFKLPFTLIHDINKIIAKFWWGDTEDKRALHWATWEKLCETKERGGMGFRDLATFNKAMLAKQYWRIRKNEDAVVSRILKARYFPNSSITDAKTKSNSSFLWRSIQWGGELAKEGGRWIIGNGRKINMFSDSFIPEFAIGQVVPKIFDATESKAAEFLDSNGNWEKEKLSGIFFPFMVEVISNIPTNPEKDDELFWRFEESGRFSVKSAYLAGRSYYAKPDNYSERRKEEWNSIIWKLKIPPKVKVFLWRAFNDFIHSEVNLRKHHVPCSELCGRCLKQWGTTQHCLLFCDKIKSVWKECWYYPFLKKMKGRNLIDIGVRLRRNIPKADFEIWCILLWLTWKFICDTEHGERNVCMSLSLTKAIDFLDCYQKVSQNFESFRSPDIEVGNKIWCPPLANRVRLDVDACCDFDNDRFGIGAVIRDENGKLVAATAKAIPHPACVTEAEIVAAMYGLGLCVRNNLDSVELFMDSMKALAEILKADGSSPWLPPEDAKLIRDIKEEIIKKFGHVRREGNEVAHFIANFGADCCDFCIWESDFPSWMYSLAEKDLMK